MTFKSNKPILNPSDILPLSTSFSLINLVQQQTNQDTRKSHSKTRSKMTAGDSKSRERYWGFKSRQNKAFQKGESRKKSKTQERSQPKTKKCSKKLPSKVIIYSKKEYRVEDPKLKTKRSQKDINNKRFSSDSLPKKVQLLPKKKKRGDNLTKQERQYNTKKSKQSLKTRLKKSKSESSLQMIPFSEISKVRKIGCKEERVIHQYFGIQNRLSSIVERDEEKLKRSKFQKCKTRSSNSSNSKMKGSLSKFGCKTVRSKK